VRVSLNGVFVNGIRVGRGEVVEVRAGDEVSVVCGDEGGGCSLGRRIGFVVERVVFVEEVVDGNDCGFREGIVSRGDVLLRKCREMLKEDLMLCNDKRRSRFVCRDVENDNLELVLSNVGENRVIGSTEVQDGAVVSTEELVRGNGVFIDNEFNRNLDGVGQLNSYLNHREVNCEPECCQVIGKNSQKMNRGKATVDCNLSNYALKTSLSLNISPKDALMVSEVECDPDCPTNNIENLQIMEATRVHSENGMANGKSAAVSAGCEVKMDGTVPNCILEKNRKGLSVPPPGKKFYLNRLHFMSHGSSEHENVVSLPELLYPVKTVVRLFITTFTSNISWFLSYCEIPTHLPVTIACHNAGKCWSPSLDDRMSVPFSDYPNLVVVYPPFPEAIAFGQDHKKLGIACHHPKLIVLQREDNIRVIITSANLVPKQWLFVTNTVWWQDFPRLSTPDSISLFTQSTEGEVNQDTRSDFAAQLAKFMATLIADVPNQAHWIMELTKYDFRGAVGHLVASIPGIHSPKIPCILDYRYSLNGASSYVSGSCGMKLLGSIEASVVGLSHLFRAAADSSGSQLKRLAVFLGKCHENAYGMSEIVLRRNLNIPADANAVAVLIPNPDKTNEGDCIQLGFLPRNIAKWAAPLSDAGLFSFSAYIYRKDVLASALEGTNKKVTLILYVSQGPSFMGMSGVTQPLLVSAICSLVASIQRSSGLWRLQEVLGHYKWPETFETDFMFGSSSTGSINAQFLAAFSAAAGKRSLQFSESEESDPDWGCWSISQELRHPSIKIIYPTIERVKSASCGILASKYLLCFSQKTWLRLRNVGILHDSIPNPIERVGHPMHVKVGMRRFQSKTNASSCGWVYCGSHNFSAAAWGRPISNIRSGVVGRTNAALGSRLHISNYEVGVVFIVPPPDALNNVNKTKESLDDIVLPFLIPAPKYKANDRPATAKAMREALAELTELEKQKYAQVEILEESEEEMPDEDEEVTESTDYVPVEKEDDNIYAEQLWSQASQSC
ncbi:FHA domain-containing protein, partial [Heracleum sosnowskyi]